MTYVCLMVGCGTDLLATAIMERYKPLMADMTGRDRSRERGKTRHRDHDEEYHRSQKRYALDDIDPRRRYSNDDNHRSTHRSRDDRPRGRSPSPTAVR